MTTVCEEAPGKVVWLGEYAVLDGAPAVVAAVDRYLRVAIAPGEGDSEVHAQNLDVPPLVFRVRAGRLDWRERTPPMARAAHVIESLHADGVLGNAPPFCCRIDSRALFAANKAKLGLGSSAAMMVALDRALRRFSAAEEPTAFEKIVALHRDFQDGRGSGVDIAAAVHGGLIIFRRSAGAASIRVRRVTRPQGLHWCAVYSGRTASTSKYLGGLSRWRSLEPAAADALFARMTRVAESAAAALAENDAAAFMSTVDEYYASLLALSHASSLDIVSGEHRALRRLAEVEGVAYKSSGAGGGDLGVGFATERRALAGFRAAASAAGFTPLDLAIASETPFKGLAGVEKSPRRW